MGDEKRKYVNTTQGYLGVVRINRRGEDEAISLEPGQHILLSDEERKLTAEGPRNSEDNPFESQAYEIRDPDTHEVSEKGHRPPLALVTQDRPTEGRAENEEQEVAAAGPAPEGSFKPGEEVGPA